jgi:hypothetical protein
MRWHLRIGPAEHRHHLARGTFGVGGRPERTLCEPHGTLFVFDHPGQDCVLIEVGAQAFLFIGMIMSVIETKADIAFAFGRLSIRSGHSKPLNLHLNLRQLSFGNHAVNALNKVYHLRYAQISSNRT